MKISLKLLFIIAILFFLIFSFATGLFSIAFNADEIMVDPLSYLESSKLFYDSFSPHPTRPILYAAISGVTRIFTDDVFFHLLWSYLLNLSCWLLQIVVLFKTLLMITKKKIAFVVSLLFVFSVGSLAISSLVMTESLIGLILTVSGYLVVKFKNENKFDYLIWFVTINILSVLIRPGMFYIAIFFLGGFVYISFRRKLILPFIKYIPIIVSLVLLFLQILLINKTYGNFTPSYIDKITWYYYLGTQISAEQNGNSYFEERNNKQELYEHLPWNEKSEIAKNDIFFRIKNNPDKIVKYYLMNIARNSVGSSPAINVSLSEKNIIFIKIIKRIPSIQNVLYILLFLLLIIVVFKKYRKIDFPLILLLSPICYIIITSGITFMQGDRLYLVFYPLILISFFYIVSRDRLFSKLFHK